MQAYVTTGDRVIADHVFLFPGQGSQAIGMGEEVRDVSPRTTTVWDCASDISGIDVRKLCRKGPMTKLTKTKYQQLAITTVSVAMYERLNELFEIRQPVYAGHSAGEYAALYAAGAFDLPTLFKAIFARSSLMQEMAEQTDGSMYVVKGMDHQSLQQHIDEAQVQAHVGIANDNSPRQVVLSGLTSAVKTVTERLQRLGFELIKLPVNGAWHSHLMSPAQTGFRDILRELPIQSPKFPLYMNMTATPEQDVARIVDNLVAHLTSTVRWRESMEQLHQQGKNQFVEMGTKKVLCNMLTGHYDNINDQIKTSCFIDWCIS